MSKNMVFFRFQGSGHLYASNCDIVNNIATNFSKKILFGPLSMPDYTVVYLLKLVRSQ